MSGNRLSDRGTSGVGLACLFALVNVPPAGLLAWLLAGPDQPASPLLRVLAAVGLSASLCGSVLLFVLVSRRGQRLREALDECHEQAAQLRCVVETAAHPILTLDESGLVLSANAATARSFGYRVSDLIGRPLKGLVSEEIAGRVNEAKTDEQRALGSAQPVDAVRKDGSRFPASLAVSKTNAPHNAGRSLFVVLIHDLTEISQTRHAAEAATRTKDSFLGRLNHELRTPLTGILGAVDLLRDTSLGDEQTRQLDVVQGSAEALLESFNQLVDHARLESGQVSLRQEAFSLRETVAQALSPLLPLARGKGICLDVEFAPDLPDQFLGDTARLAQVLVNLAGNAVKFTTAGEVVVRVAPLTPPPPLPLGSRSTGVPPVAEEHRRDACATTPVAEGAGGLRFEVTDTGIGIPPDKQQTIFEPFEQVDGSNTRKYGGVGLGLSVASRLVALMGGRIDVVSEPGKGSRFRFDVSLQPIQTPTLSEPRSVLVVLAQDEQRGTLERHLSEWGIRAAGARTGRQALTELLRAVVEGSPYGLVLIEEHLPDLSAREVLHRMRDRSQEPPPAVLLGRSETDVPLPDGVRGVLPRSATPLQTYQAVLRAFAHPT